MQEELFYGFSLERRMPANRHLLGPIKRIIDLSAIRSHLAPYLPDQSSLDRPRPANAHACASVPALHTWSTRRSVSTPVSRCRVPGFPLTPPSWRAGCTVAGGSKSGPQYLDRERLIDLSRPPSSSGCRPGTISAIASGSRAGPSHRWPLWLRQRLKHQFPLSRTQPWFSADGRNEERITNQTLSGGTKKQFTRYFPFCPIPAASEGSSVG